MIIYDVPLKYLLATLALVGCSSCVIEGGGCSGPFCFSVGTDLCDNGQRCRDTQIGRCPDADDIQNEAQSWINRVRSSSQQCGINVLPAAGSLQWSGNNFIAADKHSLDMAGNNFVAQIGSDGLGVSERLSPQSDLVQTTFSGQAVAGGFSTTRTLLEAWLEQPVECALLMQPLATDIGMACRYDGDSDFGQYWTIVLSGN